MFLPSTASSSTTEDFEGMPPTRPAATRSTWISIRDSQQSMHLRCSDHVRWTIHLPAATNCILQYTASCRRRNNPPATDADSRAVVVATSKYNLDTVDLSLPLLNSCWLVAVDGLIRWLQLYVDREWRYACTRAAIPAEATKSSWSDSCFIDVDHTIGGTMYVARRSDHGYRDKIAQIMRSMLVIILT